MAKKYSVLVVDDQDSWRELLVELLEDEFEIDNVNNYGDAVAKIRECAKPFHVVVTDMRLVDEESGNEDGLRLAKVLSQRGGMTKVIIITGYPTLRTAKRALGSLDVFDYLEKRPEDGSPFNPTEFLRTVRTAAESAEKGRPRGLTASGNHLLLLMSDAILREKLTVILKKTYEVKALDDFSNAAKAMRELEPFFVVTLMSEDLVGKTNLLDALQETQPQTKIVLLTREENNVAETMNRLPIAKIIPVSPQKPDRLRILDGIQQAVLSEYAKFGVLEVKAQDEKQEVSENTQLLMNTAYTFWLRIQDAPTPMSFPITLSPTKGERKRESISLDVFVTPVQMEITPSGKLPWSITESLEFQVTPMEKGKKKLLLEVYQGYRLIGKKEITFEIQ